MTSSRILAQAPFSALCSADGMRCAAMRWGTGVWGDWETDSIRHPHETRTQGSPSACAASLPPHGSSLLNRGGAQRRPSVTWAVPGSHSREARGIVGPGYSFLVNPNRDACELLQLQLQATAWAGLQGWRRSPGKTLLAWTRTWAWTWHSSDEIRGEVVATSKLVPGWADWLLLPHYIGTSPSRGTSDDCRT